MRSHFSRFKKFVFLAFLLGGIFFSAHQAYAGIGGPVWTMPGSVITTDLSTEKQTVVQKSDTIKQTLWQKIQKALVKAGASSLESVTRTALNKVAYDTADWVGSGGQGQKPLFVTKGWGSYLTQIGDEAAGQFVEDFANTFADDMSASQSRTKGEKGCETQYQSCIKPCNTAVIADPGKCTGDCTVKYNSCNSNVQANYQKTLTTNNTAAGNGTSKAVINLCDPSLAVRMTLALGLVKQSRPSRPNCAWSDIYKNWGSAIEAEKNNNKTFYDALNNMFSVQATDLGAALSVNTMGIEVVSEKTDTAKTTLLGKNGWIDPVNTGDQLLGLPNQAAVKTELAQQGYISNIGHFTGDALVNAGNVFLNQLAMSAFNKWMSSLQGGQASGGSSSFGGGGDSGGIYNYDSVYNSSANRQMLTNILAPQFAQNANYDVLADMATCPDEKNPGPTNCVIDEKFSQAISAQKTIGDALKDGSLNGSWALTADSKTSSYQESYSLRNAMILRASRILPVGWETAIEKSAQLGKNATLMDVVSCFSADDSYNSFSSPALSQDQSWCRGLIDPNWVLKAPQAYCAKSGFGGQIISSQVVDNGEVATGTPATSLSISRADDYCADEKTCIQEDGKGACQAYGYCTADRRTWNFGGDSCDPINNSCQTFTDSAGNAVSYLKNTLNYNLCSDANSGCLQYSVFNPLTDTYSSSTDKISWSGNAANSIYLNGKADSCDATSEGCRLLTRVKPSWGDNLIFNNDLTALNNQWQVLGSSTVATEDSVLQDGNSGSIVVFGYANQAVGLVSSGAHSVIPANATPVPGYYYTLSAEVYTLSGMNVTLKLGGSDSVSTTMGEPGVWQTVSLTAKPGDNISSLEFSITGGAGDTFYLRNIKLEANNYFSGWSNYGASTVQEKLLPNYLDALCYVNPFATGMKDFRLKDNAPAICGNFARRCNLDEVGCQTFTASDGFKVTGKVAFDEYCPQECVNYDSYVQNKTNFESVASADFIPSSATACDASVAGCASFTNLSDTSNGGENTEYYSALRRCIQPDNSKCGAFYSWNGEGESGYQLKAYSLETNNDGSLDVTSDDSNECSQTIFNLPVSDPNYNPDCHQFYDKNGHVSYHLYSRTVSCSADCRNIRLNDDVTAADCTANGGAFASSTCIFQALPSQSTTCGAESNGCREYNGNNGNNVRIAAAYDFENNVNPFTALSGSGPVGSVSTIGGGTSAANVNSATTTSVSTDKNGHSLALFGLAATSVDGLVQQGAAYSLKFLAKASAQNATLSVYFADASGNQVYFNGSDSTGGMAIGDTDWRVYQINLPNLNQRMAAGEKLFINSNQTIYLDSIVLTEITDRYYLIKNSWTTPDICYYDLNNNYRGAEYNLGCSAYTDPNGTTHNLREFASLCDVSSAGCEAMIDTQNSKNPFPQTFASSTVSLSGHQMIYAIFDSSKQCSADDIGCTRLGQGQKAGSSTFFTDVYLKNNPDNYATTMCSAAEVGCDTFYDASGGKTFFRNPFGNTCQYRASSGTNSTTWGWFKTPVDRCDLNNNGKIDGAEIGSAVCTKDGDCPNGTTATTSCIVDSNDYSCDVSYSKTIGNGSGAVPQPSKDAGLCDAASSGCSEYIDASSQSAPNLVVNPAFADLDGNGTGGDMWISQGGTYSQDIFLVANKLYIADQTGSSVANTLTCDNFNSVPVLSILGNDNQISTTTVSSVQITSGQGVYLIPRYNSVCHLTSNTDASGNHANLELRESIVNYQVDSNVDTKTCGSKVDVNSGCILFNNRAYTSSAGQVSPLSYNVFTSPNTAGTADNNCSGNTCNANLVAKVTPNRVCSKWLACTTKIKDEKTGQDSCYGLAECDKLSPTGDCADFVGTNSSTHNFAAAADANSTGYQLMNSFYLSNMREVGSRTGSLISPINFEDGVLDGLNRQINFNRSGIASEASGVPTDFQIINEPSPTDPAKKFSVSYPAEGQAFVGIPANRMLGIRPVVLSANTDYYLDYLVNTDALTSGGKALVRVTKGDSATSVIKDFVDRTNGWQRVVHRINVGQTSVGIFFGTQQTPGIGGKVYYDDINIEPVLKINNTGNDSQDYLSKECRIYPGEDSLTCAIHDSNVIQSGLEGYCLQHDPLNSSVCLQWLPLDTIAAASIVQKNEGYKGPFPLYYCSEANANFDLVEKRVAFLAMSYSYPDADTYPGDSDNGDGMACSYAGADLGFCDASRYSPRSAVKIYNYPNSPAFVNSICGSTSKYFVIEVWGWKSADWFCVPNPNDNQVSIPPGSPKIRPLSWLLTRRADFVGHWGTIDDSADTDMAAGDFGTNGWYLHSGPYTSIAGSGGWSGDDLKEIVYPHYDAGILNPSPNLRVYDYNNPPTSESTLKYIDSHGTTDASDIFLPTCKKLVKVIDENGHGMPWVDRLSNQDYGTTTPDFFPKITSSLLGYSATSPFNLANSFFGLDLPGTQNYLYGAAVLKGLQVGGQTAIGFLTETNSGDIATAGRPYGCQDNGHGSCQYLGFCNNHPEIICLTVNVIGDVSTATGDNYSTCPNGDTCTSFGFKSETGDSNESNDHNYVQKNVLKNIFLQGKEAFNLSSGSNTYSDDSISSYDALNASSSSGVYPIKACSGGFRPNPNTNFGESNTQDTDFCAIYPIIKNINLFSGDGSGAALASTSLNTWNIGPGLYTLKFNSVVDLEQQPLGEITVDWGDGRIDKIDNQDSHPDTPHAISHNYSYTSGVASSNRTIKIKIVDNWNLYTCSPAGACPGQ